jgi:hypothetical protein
MKGSVVCHQLIIGELVCGNFQNRKEIISLLQALPKVPQISFDEYLYFVEKRNLFGKGIGYIDIHLLASAKLSQTKLWTLDKRLNKQAVELEIDYKI